MCRLLVDFDLRIAPIFIGCVVLFRALARLSISQFGMGIGFRIRFVFRKTGTHYLLD
jgi:hypothetical protein